VLGYERRNGISVGIWNKERNEERKKERIYFISRSFHDEWITSFGVIASIVFQKQGKLLFIPLLTNIYVKQLINIYHAINLESFYQTISIAAMMSITVPNSPNTQHVASLELCRQGIHSIHRIPLPNSDIRFSFHRPRPTNSSKTVSQC
jgi:hypothetical protein